MKAPLNPILAKALKKGNQRELTRRNLLDLRHGSSVVEIDGVKYEIKRLGSKSIKRK